VHDTGHEGDSQDEEKEPGDSKGPEEPAEALTVGPWTDEQILEVIRTGTTPEGFRLLSTMPRWRVDDTDGAALLEYLGELGE
jgi:hypothetical protein